MPINWINVPKTDSTVLCRFDFIARHLVVCKRDVLKQALLDVGLNAEEGMALLNNEEARNEIKATEKYWKELGMNSVPTIVFDRKSAVTGAQPVDVFKQVLTDALEQR